MFCPQCGHPNLESARFCADCGGVVALPPPASKRPARLWQFVLIGCGGLGVLALGVLFVIWIAPGLTRRDADLPSLTEIAAAQPLATATTEPGATTPTPEEALASPIPTVANLSPLPSKTPTPALTATPPELDPAAIPASVAPVAFSEFDIVATEARFNTGISLSPGQQVTIEYLRGSWRAGPSPAWPLVGPQGDSQVASKATLPVPDAPIMSLIVGVGNGRPSIVNERLLLTATTAGQLWLGANDDNFSDNSGSLTVRVTVEPSPILNPLLTTEVEARRVLSPPTVDGLLTEWAEFPAYWSGHRVYAHPGWDGTEDLVAFWHLGWDDNYLYIAATIIDDTHVQTQTGNQIYRGDSLEMQINTNPTAGLDYPTPAIFQITLSPGDFSGIPPSAFRFRGNTQRQIRDAPGHAILVAARQTDGGYALEAAIPWRDLEVTPYEGLVLGLALNANDNDMVGTAVQEVMMSNSPDRTLSNPATWGSLKLTP